MDKIIKNAEGAIKQKDYESAADLYSQLLEMTAKKHGEMSVNMAKLLLDYGFVLLKLGQNKNRVFRDKKMEKSLAQKIEKMQNPDVKMKDHFEDDDDDDEDDDLELAWQNLELARVIFEKSLKNTKKYSHLLARTYVILGDLSSENDNFKQALCDYQKSLKYHDTKDYKFFCDVCIQSAVCYLYISLPEEAIKEYENAISALQKSNLKNDKSLLQDLTERVDDMKKKMKMSEEDKNPFGDLFFEGNSIQTNVLQPVNLLNEDSNKDNDKMEMD